ncbi:coiled-coil-helix-coiled-coil-helix domain containing 3b isoform X1 [Clarias gariepinus]|uniref:coiled-coil-helix-coiled-coil-helix domain containing 3b isoform X1 n=1 Tax=Clarias gariepinus TaxID=13013 RepID=UPI00234C9409|nr:coiled-coil-helix-coiled-coil-helix domain containing 3b isoform X1 [Clarias gariepinus]
MGGSSSSRGISEEPEGAEGVVLVKGIRVTDRVIDRMRESPPVQRPQSKSPPEGHPLIPQSETLALTELLAPVPPHPPSYATALVPPPLQEPISPLVSVGQETPSPPTSTTDVKEVPLVTHISPEPLPSVQEHMVVSTPDDPVILASPAEHLTITAFPLTFPDSVDVSLPAEPVPGVLSPSAEAVDISSPPVADTVMSPLSESIALPVDASTMRLTAQPVEAIPLSATVDTPINNSTESTLVCTPTLTKDTTTPGEQHVELPAKPTSKLLAEFEKPLSPDTPLKASTELVDISEDVPPTDVNYCDLPIKLEDLLPPLSSSALTVSCEVGAVGQIRSPLNQDTTAPTSFTEPAVAPVLPHLTETVGQLSSPQALVNEEELRRQIREELQKLLQEEIRIEELKIQQQLEVEKAKAEAEAQANAQRQIQAEVQKVLEKEHLALQQTLKDTIKLASQYYRLERKIQKLEEKERNMTKQDSMYREQIAMLEEKTALIARATAENFRKGLEETENRFKRYQMKPVCSELHSEILKCYLQNTGQTLTCSSIASQYVRCVNNAKQNKKVNTVG